MEKLQQYLDTQFKQDNERLEDILSLIRNTLPMFYESFDQRSGWPYEVKGKVAHSKIVPPFSCGTVAMTCGALKTLRRADLPEKKVYKTWPCREKGSGEDEESLETLTEKTVVKTFSLLTKNLGTQRKLITSRTYGDNSVFVLSWLCDLIDKNPQKDPSQSLGDGQRDLVIKYAKTRLNETLLYIDHPEKIQYYKENKSDPTKNPKINVKHAFPLLKTIHMFDKLRSLGELQNKSKKPVDLEKLEEYLLNRLHYFISLAEIENSRFDAAELVFSLEGLLIVRKLRFDPDEGSENASIFLCSRDLLERVFSILEKKQKINSYWRPLSPFITTQRGLALLPISVEITLSLLRICEILGKTGKELFARNSDIFARYFDWVKSKVTAVPCGDRRVYGWASEHVYSSDTIHIWQTSQILIFLTKYYSFLRDKIAADALAAANLSISEPKKKIPQFWENEPFGSIKVHKQIKEIINESKFENYSASFLLYGPPGTGKTTFAKQIAALKDWPLLSLSPSDFIADGVDKLENKAKNLFKVLCAQHDLVILFDEIDRLLLNRNSEAYRDQGDMFQVMVASLLVKFKDLRDTPHIIFLIGTNYGYRLDPAIVRPGRIDKQILVMLPDLAEREKAIQKNIDDYKEKHAEAFPAVDCKDLSKKTPLFSYGELEQLVDEIAKNRDKPEQCVDSIIPMVSLSQYTNQITQIKDGIDTGNVRPAEDLPLDEILMVAYTRFECDQNDDKLKKEKDNLQKLMEKHEELALDKIKAVLGENVHGKIKEMLQKLGITI